MLYFKRCRATCFVSASLWRVPAMRQGAEGLMRLAQISQAKRTEENHTVLYKSLFREPQNGSYFFNLQEGINNV